MFGAAGRIWVTALRPDPQKGVVPHSSGQWDEQQIPTLSQQSRAYAILAGRRWVGTHFRRPCWSVLGSGRMCSNSGGSWSRPSDMDPDKPVFISGASNPASSSLRGLPTWLQPSLGPKACLKPLGVSELRPCTWTLLKMLRATLVQSVGRTTNTDFLPAVEPDSLGRTLLSALLTLLFCIYVLFIQYTCSTYFFFFCVFFLAPNRLQHWPTSTMV